MPDPPDEMEGGVEKIKDGKRRHGVKDARGRQRREELKRKRKKRRRDRRERP